MDKNIKRKVIYFRKKLINRETVVYVIAGIMTTMVNLIAYGFLCNVLKVYYLISNLISWVIAVIFAYMTNNSWVFHDKSDSIKIEIIKILKFFGVRVFSLFIEEAGLFLFVKAAGFNNMVVKVVLSIIVIILNYLFSKLYIFKGSKE
ncbi:MAG: putative membrane protein [Lachnoclostridium sp.]|jgi:putative flippase GtrA